VIDAARRRRFSKRALALGALAGLFFPSEARAQDHWAAGAGLRLYFALEDTRGSAFGWSLSAFRTQLLDGENHTCSSEARTALGPVVSVGALGRSAPRVSLMGFLGREAGRGQVAFGSELGLTYRFGEREGLGIHAALVPSLVIFHVAVQREFLLGETGLGGGVWYEMPYGEAGICVEGRALRGADSAVKRLEPAIVRDRGARTACLAPELALRALARDAQAECESIAAFVQLALELVELDAPKRLIERTLLAAEQELEHARSVASLAARFGASVTPVFPRFAPRAAASTSDALARLAVESYVDGVIGEGWAARRAGDGARTAADPTTRAVRARIARDEARHAELGWQLIDFALAAGGPRVAEVLSAARDTGVRDGLSSEPEARDWPELGRVAAGRSAELAELTLREARRGLEQRLSQRS